MIHISVIGTAGRKEYKSKMNKKVYKKMYKHLCETITNICEKHDCNLSNIELVSGGAAWADHLAVKFFNKHHTCGVQLSLYLPCGWTGVKYEDNGAFDFRINPGGTSNYYHNNFSKEIGYNTLLEIQDAIDHGCKIHIGKGFFDRNNHVAQSDILLAYTWGDNKPNDGGTLYTWNKCKTERIHFSIGKL